MIKSSLIISMLMIVTLAWGKEDPHTTSDKSPYDHSWYIGTALGSLRYRQANLNDFDARDFRLVLGKQINRAIAAEIHLGSGTSATERVLGVPVTLSFDNYVAGFLKANLTFASEDWDYNRVRLYALLGGTRVQATSSDSINTQSGVQTSVAGGVGVEVFLDNVGIQLGYTRYLKGDFNGNDYTLDSLYLGFTYQFGDNVEDYVK
jgi:hypothetical protein